MLRFSEMRGAIFDLDDMLIDNGPADHPELWLHSRSRLAAVHAVADQRDLPNLGSLTAEENGRAFTTARTHSLHGAIWNIFYMKGLAPSAEIDAESSLYPLLLEIAERKNELHEPILREYGIEVPGASAFISSLALHGLTNYLALATSAVRRDIDIFLGKYRLQTFFPDSHIISAEKVTKPKPDPECFDLAFRSLDLPDSDRWHVAAFEDDPRGIMSAKQTGLFVCAITTKFKRDDPKLISAEPDLIADSYEEFRSLLGIPALTS